MARGSKPRTTSAPAPVGSSSHQHLFNLADMDLQPEDAAVETTVHRISDDRRRLYVEVVPVNPPSPVKKRRLNASGAPKPPVTNVDPDPFAGFEFVLNHERYNLFEDDEGEPGPEPLPRPTEELLARVVKPADVSLDNW
ncbi:hypothetical protein B0H16DRAFT_1748279 [Mycena metata]|uniref:Uncharacterized protein n=1 Tax=Mycena metata TaxID=1033252 RepID=A0AAD7DZJ4_9AGAR|nr:hypothetical protein B0H16DRAFT_1748279 [Mycena metata]